MNTTDAEASSSAQPDENSAPAPSDEAEDTDNDRQLSLDGSDADAFDESWDAINEEHSEQEQLRFNVGVLAVTVQYLQPEEDEQPVDTSNIPGALDGKTPEQIDTLAQEELDGFVELDELSQETARELYEEFGLDIDDDLSISVITEAIEAAFSPEEESDSRDEVDAGPYERWAATVAQLTQMVETYYMTHDELPEDLEALTEGDTPITEEIPDDPWGNDYIYEQEGERDFTIISKGEDGELGTELDLTSE